MYPKGLREDGIMRVCLFASQAESQPSGWSQHVHFSVTMVGRCRLIVTKPELKAPMVSALETTI